VAFEAGACHTPFVSTRVGILAEVARDGIHGFFAAKPHEFAGRITKLLRDPELRERMGSNFSAVVASLFGWSKAIENYAMTYLRML